MKSVVAKRKKKTWKEALTSHPLARLETALVIGALIAGVGSAGLSEMNRKAANEELLAKYELRSVIVARADLTRGSVLSEASLQTSHVLASALTKNMVEPQDLKNVIGRRIGVEFRAGDPLLLTAVEGAGMADTIASRIPPGKRLVTLAIADKVAANGWIKPNDHVDVVAHMELPGRGATTVTLLEDVTLVSVGKATVWEDGKNSEGAEIGFFVSPKEVEFISFAQQQGRFSLALRNPKDIRQHEQTIQDLGTAGVDMKNFHDHQNLRRATGGGDLDIRVNGKKIDTKDEK